MPEGKADTWKSIQLQMEDNMSEKEEEVWVVKGELGGETAWTTSKVKFRKRLGKRLLVIGLLFWLGVLFGAYTLVALICILPAIIFPIAGLILYYGGKNAEDIGKVKLQERG